jgi:hypothetical protein
VARLDSIANSDSGWFGEHEQSLPASKQPGVQAASTLLRNGMTTLHRAQGLHDEGKVDAAREQILRAKQEFQKANDKAPMGTKAKISAAIGVLDGLSGGLTEETKQLPTANEFLPHIPAPIAEAIKMGIIQSIQALNPAEWLTSPDRVVHKWLDVQGLTTPNDVQKFFEEKLTHPQSEDNQKKNKKSGPKRA